MVNGPTEETSPRVSRTASPGAEGSERPFALRATVFTAGFLLFILGVVPSLFYLAGKVPSWPIEFSTEVRVFWSGFVKLLGAALFVIGLAAYLFCSGWLIFHGRGPHVEFDPPTVFVATGPYRWVRNPVVICLIATVLGEALYLASLGIFVLVLVGLPLAHLQVTCIEEPRLVRRFGASYERYCREVPRWIPRPPRSGEASS